MPALLVPGQGTCGAPGKKMVRVLTKIRYHVKSGFRHGFKNIIFSKFFFGFVASIGVILSSHDKTGRIKDNLNARLHDTEDTFDFVIGTSL